MPRRNRPREHRQATRQEISKITYLGFELYELFNEEELADIVSVAKHSVAGEFFHAKEPNPRLRFRTDRRNKYETSTDNYIIGISGRPNQLARYVAEMTHRQIVHQSQLPSNLQELKQAFIDAIVAQARYSVILIAINILRDKGDIWYDEGRGIWCTEQHVIDTYLEDKDLRRKAKRALRYDRRNFHGKTDAWRNGGVQLA